VLFLILNVLLGLRYYCNNVEYFNLNETHSITAATIETKTTTRTKIKTTKTTPNGINNKNINNNNNNSSGLEFVFYIGIEGTGHHFIQTVLKHSPYNKRWLPIRESLTKIQFALMNQKGHTTNDGLFNMHCRDTTSTKKKNNSNNNNNNNSTATNSKDLYNDVVEQFKSIQEMYDGNDQKRRSLYIPINANGNEGAHGMMSYPNFDKQCRELMYPVLDLLYMACEEARVECTHVYLYRHPFEILQSTTLKRDFNKLGMVSGSHLYTSMLKIIQTQLIDYPSKNRGCLGLFESDALLVKEWQSNIQNMWGWKENDAAFETFLKRFYHKPTNIAYRSTSNDIVLEEVDKLTFPKDHLPYLENLLRAHERTIQLCQDQYQQQQQQQQQQQIMLNS
jgi:hypothetical protein